MKIVHLLAPARIGGLERVVQGLAIGQSKRNDDVTVLAVGEEPMAADHPFRVPLDLAGVKISEVVVPPRRYRLERQTISNLLRELAPDVVHSHGSRTDVVDAEAIRGLGIPTVSTLHGWTRGSLKNRFYEYVHRRSLRRFDAVIAVSEPIASQLTSDGVPGDRVYMIRNGFSAVAEPAPRDDARRLLDLPPDARVVGWVGRLSREKGIDVLVEAMGLIRDDDIVACVLGDGAEREREQQHADRVGARILWKGMVPMASRLVKAFDVFVQSSRTEGTPIALLEAIAAEAPVVATRVGGVPDVVSGSEAILVPSENPAALADAIRRVFAKPDAAAERVRRAKLRLSSEFNAETWLDRHQEIYARAAAQRRRAASAP
ncbi:MAG TPA: glycosyltransferase [Gemmatimonadaceae bacterium]|jgi:glycosyltransferase involved in cell wall biosynthesis|nr:glycosyltransferase [Gemmatimonadaceae bacterium]